MLQNVFLVIHVLIAVTLVVIILIQHGKGADAGAAFGSGASQTVFGASGSTSFMTRLTTGLAITFFLTSLTLAYFTNTKMEITSVTDTVPQQAPKTPASDIPGSDIPGGKAVEDAVRTVDDIPLSPASYSQGIPGDAARDIPSDILGTPKP